MTDIDNLLSVIIPCFNSAESVRKLIDSVLVECESAQIVVVDDNSTKDIDKLEEVKADFADRVIFVKNDTGVKGAGAARNVGLKNATGRWLLFADADDVFLPGWYLAVSDYFDKNIDIVFFNPTSVMLPSGTLGQRHHVYSHYVSEYVKEPSKEAELYLRYFFIVPWSKLIRSSAVKDNGVRFDEVMYSNDVMFSIKSGFFAHRITADSRQIYCVTEKDGTLTGNMTEEAWGIRHEVFSRRNLFLREHLNDKEFTFMKKRMGAFGRLVEAARRHCGLGNFIKYCNMYRVNRVPVIYSMFFMLKCKLGTIVKKLSKKGSE